tara:strand:- start:4772 stop:6355 length:1584 start_codon:yes stop_codon:yes gene_type:complete
MSGRLGIYSQAAGGELPLLLDVYTGAAAAYSLRKIAVATTNVIRVRRTNGLLPEVQDFTAQQITDGTLLAFTGSGDGRVVTWYDQSGNNAHATQASLSRQPRIVLNGALVLDSSGVNPTIEFHIGNFGSVLNAPLVSAQPLTLFNLRRYRLAGTGTRVAIGYAGGGNGYADNNIGGLFRSYYGSYLIYGANNTNREVFYSLANGASTAISLNGGSEVIGNAGTAGASALTIGAAGGNFYPRVNEQEVIIYASNQSSNKSGILTNINTHYNLYPEPISGFLYDYSGASLAYSLRQLGVFVNGEVNVVRIRRSSDNTLQDFNTTQITDGTLTTFTGSGNGFVETWYDQSGNGNDSTQLTPSLQPKLVSAGVVITDNGKPSIQFDSSGLLYFNMTTALSNIRSVFYTLNPEINGSSWQQFMLGSANNVDYHSGASQEWLYAAGNTQVTGGDNKINGTTTDLLNTTRALNQTLVSMIHTSSTGRADNISKDRAITGRGWLGKMQELVIYSTDESSNQVGIRNNINTHYSIY